jgi:hypothetical protein
MSYKYIAITAKIAPLATVLTEAYHKGVMGESRLANAAPDLLNAARYVEALLVTVGDPSLSDDDRRMWIESAQRVLRVAIESATDTGVQS